MKKSLGKRITQSFLLILITIIIITDALLIFGIREFYYKSLENTLINRIKISMDFFYKNYSDKSLLEIVTEEDELILYETDSEVQIIDEKGRLLYDTIGVISNEKISTPDIDNAKNESIGTWIGKSNSTNEMVLVVTSAIYKEDKIIGYIRYIASLEIANKAIIRCLVIIIAIIALIIVIAGLFSLIFSKSITDSINEVIAVANKLTDGQYKSRANIHTNDELEELSNSINKLGEEIVNKDKIKNDFISSISHELRTPLTSIKGWAVVLKDSDPSNEELISDGLNIIEKESDRLSKMVEELLDFSRYISGRIKLEKEPFNISQTCIEVQKQMGIRAELNKIEFISDLYSEPVLTIGDENRIRQIIINLIDNAIKFTSENGWVKLETKLEGDNFLISVSDNGLGMSKEELLHVKEKFYKGKHSKSHSGLGLSISDEIAKLHGGKLEIFSELNLGTVVKVTIPIIKEGQTI